MTWLTVSPVACQLTSDGMQFYRIAVEAAFGWWGTDFASAYEDLRGRLGNRQGPLQPRPICIGAEKYVVMGDPEPRR